MYGPGVFRQKQCSGAPLRRQSFVREKQTAVRLRGNESATGYEKRRTKLPCTRLVCASCRLQGKRGCHSLAWKSHAGSRRRNSKDSSLCCYFEQHQPAVERAALPLSLRAAEKITLAAAQETSTECTDVAYVGEGEGAAQHWL